MNSSLTRAMRRWQYSDTISDFLAKSQDAIMGEIANTSGYTIEPNQRRAWHKQIDHLQTILQLFDKGGKVYFEFDVPRMGKRIDTVVVIGPVVFVIEYKVGETDYAQYAVLQVWDYALDLKHFHETSHDTLMVPVLVATEAPSVEWTLETSADADGLYRPVCTNIAGLAKVMRQTLGFHEGALAIDPVRWENGRYAPTPTIVVAATVLYAGHSVANISRSDAGAQNLTKTSQSIEKLIRDARTHKLKVLCLVTGVPGAGKTLVGLNVANKHTDPTSELYSVYLSGNGPLVAILHEALARDRVERDRQNQIRTTKGEARQAVKQFIQNVHHFRDTCLKDKDRPPIEHVAIFDEAQRAWNLEQTASFMTRKKGVVGFNLSEPEFLISCLDRHPDWAVVIGLVGGGQEINTGEAGIVEWVHAIERSFPGWQIHLSPQLTDSEYGAGAEIERLKGKSGVVLNKDLHLSVSMRSFRAEHVASWVKAVLDMDGDGIATHWAAIREKFPVVLTRDIRQAKQWLKRQARGTERYGLVVSSQAQRLKPHAIDVRTPIEPVHWFLDDCTDVRSSYYMEDVATEFQVQGLELDWACVVWDGDFRYQNGQWTHHSFVGSRWQRIHKAERQIYQKNAYRVLLTRARQGMVIVVPEGAADDPTREPAFYDETFRYLAECGLTVI